MLGGRDLISPQYMGVIQQVECWLWEPVVLGSSPSTHTNGLCSVIRLAQDICNVLEEFKSHKVHTMFSCFHNVELLLEPSFEQLEVKETTLLGYSWKVKQKTVNLQMRVQFPLPQLIGTQFNGKTSDSKSER